MTYPISTLKRSRTIPGILLLGLIGCLLVYAGENVVLLALSLCIYGLVVWVIFRNTGGFILSPALLFFLFYTVFTYIFGLELFFTNGYGVSYGGGERNYTFYVALHGGILAFAFGLLIATLALHFSSAAELARYRKTPWQNPNHTPGDYIALALIGAVALLMTVIYVKNRGSIPLLQILEVQGGGDVYEKYNVARAEFSRYGRGAGRYFYGGYFQQFYIVILPFVTIFIGALYLHYRKTFLRILWLMMAVLTGFFLAMSLQRWPLMFFVVMNYILYASYAGRIKIFHALTFGGLTVLLFIALTYIRGMGDLAMVLYWVQNRIFMTNVDVLYSIFEMFPEHFPFLGGKAIWSDIRGILPGPDIGFSRWLFDALYRVYGSGTTPTLFWGELYADFGLPGVLVGSLLSGTVMQGLYIAFIRGRKTLMRLVVYTVLTIALTGLSVTYPVSAMFSLGAVTVLLLAVALEVLRWIFQAGPFPVPSASITNPASRGR